MGLGMDFIFSPISVWVWIWVWVWIFGFGFGFGNCKTRARSYPLSSLAERACNVLGNGGWPPEIEGVQPKMKENKR